MAGVDPRAATSTPANSATNPPTTSSGTALAKTPALRNATAPANPAPDSTSSPRPVISSRARIALHRAQNGHAGATTDLRTSVTATANTTGMTNRPYDHAGGRDT